MNNKIIIMLSAKRCGSTAIFNLFQKHPKVKILHKNQNIDNWEPQFWLYAYKALSGKINDVNQFNNRLISTLNFKDKELYQKYDEKKIFDIFDKILIKFGPVIFDKSPQYLGLIDSIYLLKRYIQNRPNISLKLFAFIRNPLDAITSQHELWKDYTKEESLNEREQNWLLKYNNLEKLKTNNNIKLFKYEKFCKSPEKNTMMLMEYCNLEYHKNLCSHLKLISDGRYLVSPFRNVRNWKIGRELLEHMIKYGYDQRINKISFNKKLKILLSSFKRIFISLLRKLFKK